jgi:hypothetical protein
MRGPVTLLAILPAPNQLTREQLLRASQPSSTSNHHVVATESSKIDFQPFTAITDEHYRLYHQI